MTFWRKLLYFMTGVGLGTAMVFFLFGDRDIQCSYFPNDRVLHDLRKKEFIAEGQPACLFSCYGLDSSAVSHMLHNAGVNFSESDTDRDSCRIYQLEGEWNSRRLIFTLENCEEKARLLELEYGEEGDSCGC